MARALGDKNYLFSELGDVGLTHAAALHTLHAVDMARIGHFADCYYLSFVHILSVNKRVFIFSAFNNAPSLKSGTQIMLIFPFGL